MDNTTVNSPVGKHSSSETGIDANCGSSSNSNPVRDSPKMEVKPDSELKEPAQVEEGHQEIANIENVQQVSSPETDYTLETISEDIDSFLSDCDQQEAKMVDYAEKEEKRETDEEDENTTLSLEVPAFIEKFLDLVEEMIAKHESCDEKVEWCQLPDNGSSVFEAVNRISKLTCCFSKFRSDPKHSTLVNRIGSIQQRAMSYLEDEFRLLLEDYKSSINKVQDHSNDSEGEQQEGECCAIPGAEFKSTDPEDSFLGYSDDVVTILCNMSKEMIDGGFESECFQVYVITRRQALDECLDKMGFEKMSIDEVLKMQWDALEREIPAWINTFKECTNIYFPKEYKLAEAVFIGRPSISSFLFSNLARGVMIQLLNFTDGVAMSNHSAEKLFKFLDMYETLRDSIIAVDKLFPEEREHEFKTEMITAKCRIGVAAVNIFCDLENSIESDTGKTPMPGGAVHPLARYTMNYLKYACEYMTTLEEVFKEHSKIECSDSGTNELNSEGESQDIKKHNAKEDISPFSVQLMRVMDLLDSNLEAKSKLYKDIPLSNIFMMNNGRYILQKIKGSAEIYEVVGDSSCRKKSSDIRNFHKCYQRETWGKLLSFLAHEGLQVHGKVQKPVLKERFKNFSMMFDEIHRTQSSWVVSDEQLKSELRISISSVVIPAYRSFLGRFSQLLDPGRQYDKYIKYQPEDLETCIDELFDGNSTR